MYSDEATLFSRFSTSGFQHWRAKRNGLKDALLSIIGSRQYVDWRQFRHADIRTTAVREAIERFCEKIVEALREPWVSPEERRKQQEIDTEQRTGSTGVAESPTGPVLQPAGIDPALARGPLTLRTARQSGELDMADLAVFRDAPFAPELVVIPAGEFRMGSREGEEGSSENERPQHRVTIGRRFAIGRYPVTFDEYDRFCAATPRKNPADAGWGRGRRPVINVNWDDAHAYIAWLSQETGHTYRLPSEVEWEYACRAGTMTRYSIGNAITPDHANYGDSRRGRTSEVGNYPANRWGLHDMHGNVWEWVEDDWHENYQGAPSDGSAWKDAGAARNPRLCVLRGGSWGGNSRDCRSAFRSESGSKSRAHAIGFRVARTLS
jgi:formylglycine-generating enzyme required for sulfatase activity